MTDSPVNTQTQEGYVDGQAQAKQVEPNDGRHFSSVSSTVTDYVVLDANSDLAVQVPEGVGASTAGHSSPMGEVFARGTAEEQFAKAEADGGEEKPDAVAEDAPAAEPAASDDDKSAAADDSSSKSAKNS